MFIKCIKHIRTADGALLPTEDDQEVINIPPSTLNLSPLRATTEDARFTITASSYREIAAENIASEMLQVDADTLQSICNKW